MSDGRGGPGRRPAPLRFLAALLLGVFAPAVAPAVAGADRFVPSDSLRWPAGSEVIRFENLEGMVLLEATLRGHAGVDTSGLLALDTGAGYLALDRELAGILGVADGVGEPSAVDLATRPLPALRVGSWTMEAVAPVLTVDGAIVRRVSDRPVLGLLGHEPVARHLLWIDYREQVLVLIPGSAHGADAPPATGTAYPGPPAERQDTDGALGRSRARLGRALTQRAVAVPFRLVGDGKILVRGSVAGSGRPRERQSLQLLIDTGATKCVLFEETLEPGLRHSGWPALRGLIAPTLIGAAPARIARLPLLELETAGPPLRVTGVDAGVIESGLSGVLARVTRETIHGLIGYSLLKRFRVVVDYPHGVLWLDPIPGYREERPFEYCHVGLQLERRDGAALVMGVVEGSPAARAGIRPGDELRALDGTPAGEIELAELARRMEGRPGSALTLVLRRDAVDRTVRLVRRRLL